MKKLTIEADVENLDVVTAFIDEQLEEFGFPMELMMHVELCAEEIFTNISSYAYKDGKGMVEITVDQLFDPERVRIVFSDCGIPFDPLTVSVPDAACSLEGSRIGGWGIHMVKNQVDGISYSYKDGCNVLVVEKAATFTHRG